MTRLRLFCFAMTLALLFWASPPRANQVKAAWDNPNSVALAGVYIYYGLTSQASVDEPAGGGPAPYDLRHDEKGESPTEATITLPSIGRWYFRATAYVLDKDQNIIESVFSNEAVFDNELLAPVSLRITFDGSVTVTVEGQVRGVLSPPSVGQ
jgi:hypothetical protein